MKAKLILLILLLFFTSTRFFGQSINRLKAANNETPESSVKNHATDAFGSADYTSNFLKSTEEIKEELRLELSCDDNSYSDEALLIFNNSDPNEGTPKFFSMYATAPELWSVKNGQKYSISFLGGLDSTIVVPITAKAGLPGNYTITCSQLESFGANTEISIEDRNTGTFIKLGDTLSYTFAVSAAAILDNRFYLHFTDKTAIPPKDLTTIQDMGIAHNFKIYSADGAILISSIQKQRAEIVVFDINGRKIATGSLNAGSDAKIDIRGKTGVYIVSILTSKSLKSTKIIVR